MTSPPPPLLILLPSFSGEVLRANEQQLVVQLPDDSSLYYYKTNSSLDFFNSSILNFLQAARTDTARFAPSNASSLLRHAALKFSDERDIALTTKSKGKMKAMTEDVVMKGEEEEEEEWFEAAKPGEENQVQELLKVTMPPGYALPPPPPPSLLRSHTLSKAAGGSLVAIRYVPLNSAPEESSYVAGTHDSTAPLRNLSRSLLGNVDEDPGRARNSKKRRSDASSSGAGQEDES